MTINPKSLNPLLKSKKELFFRLWVNEILPIRFYEKLGFQAEKSDWTSIYKMHFDIKESSKFVNSLVDYSADGGGNIQMRVAGIRKALHTAQSPSEFSVDEQLLKSCDWDKLNEMFNNILI